MHGDGASLSSSFSGFDDDDDMAGRRRSPPSLDKGARAATQCVAASSLYMDARAVAAPAD